MLNQFISTKLQILPRGSFTINSRPHTRSNHAHSTHPLIDQIALANTWQAPSRIISASYAGNPDTGIQNLFLLLYEASVFIIILLLFRKCQTCKLDG